MKVIVVLLVFMSWVGYSHTDAEKRRYVDAILTRTANVASDDNWASEGRDPDPNNVLESWEGFLGRPGGNTWVGGWSIVGGTQSQPCSLYDEMADAMSCSTSSTVSTKSWISVARRKKGIFRYKCSTVLWWVHPIMCGIRGF